MMETGKCVNESGDPFGLFLYLLMNRSVINGQLRIVRCDWAVRLSLEMR
jgi:hypothetical protein